MDFTVTKTLKTSYYFNDFGLISPTFPVEYTITFSDPDINTVKILNEESGTVKEIHEVVFKVTCENCLQNGYCTKLIDSEAGETEDTILNSAKDLILRDL